MSEKTKLSNGVRVILDEMPSLHSATASLWVDCTRHQLNNQVDGIAHFVEHMLFKGTQKRESFRIVQDIEDTGGSINAITDKETTCYYARVLSDQIPTALDVLADMTQNPQFAAENVALEQQVIAHEIRMGENAPDTRILEQFIQAVWGSHPLAQPVIGTEASIQSLNRDTLLAFHQAFYTPENLIVSVAGRFDKALVLEQVETLFGHLTSPANPPALESSEPGYEPCHLHLQPESEQALFCIGGRGINACSPDRYALGVLDVILGGGMSSRLFQELRQEKGLVYSIHTFELLYRHTGLFGLFAQTHPDSLNTVCAQILRTFDDLMANGPTEEELARAKRKICGNLLLNMESTRYRAARNARTEIYQGEQKPMSDVQRLIENMSSHDLQTLCQSLMLRDNLSYAYTGPTALTLPKMNPIS